MGTLAVSDVQDTDKALLDRVRAGDQRAFDVLIETHGPALLRFAMAQLQDPRDSEDVVQDVFMRMWSERERLGEARSARSYLMTAVRNRAIDKMRRLRLERRWIEPLSAPGEPHERDPLSMVPDPKAVGDPASLAELDAAIQHLVESLPERGRTAFRLCRDQGLSYAEAAEIMGVSAVTVRTHVVRALTTMRKALHPFLGLMLVLQRFVT
jgi:RNA polymerase sigma-70 factor, ECF subfamily